MTLADFHAMSLDQLNAWLADQNAELAKMHDWMETNEALCRLAYRVLKEKMAR